jgi:hypothetical protein
MTGTGEVTRTEIAAALAGALSDGPLMASELAATASRNGARPEVLAALERLPGRGFSDIRQIWTFMQGVPIS